MTPFAANPFVFIFMAVILVGALAWYGYGMLDHMGLSEERAQAVVTGKQFNPPGVTYRTNIVAGRAWTMTDATSETYVLTLVIGTEPTVALVSKQRYDALHANDTVQVRMRRTRFSGRLEVIEVLS